MKIALIVLLSLFIGCQTYNSNTADAEKYGESNLVGSAEFRDSYRILQQKCMSCHNYHQDWAAYTNEQDWLGKGDLVVSGDPLGSELIKRIFNSGENNSNMPLGGQPLPDQEYDKLVEWIENLTP